LASALALLTALALAGCAASGPAESAAETATEASAVTEVAILTTTKDAASVTDEALQPGTPRPPASPQDEALPPDEALAPELGDVRTRSRDAMAMVYVPAGQFEIGSSDAHLDAAMRLCVETLREGDSCQRDAYLDEQPVHTVSLDGFWIDRTEVTNAQFAAFLNDQGNQVEEGIAWLEPGAGHRGVVYGQIEEADGVFRARQGYEDYPLVEVSWYGARAYCAWAGGRLPTEAEWEYAARGPEGRVYPWGDEFDGSLVNYDGTGYHGGGEVRWMPAGSLPQGASWCGALDMAGNVWEWVSDWWSDDYYARSPAENPQGPESGDVRIGRGGSWYDTAWHVRSAYRKGLSPSSYRIHWVGVRCVVPMP
jgi:formylglycine-generating enzyme required for sulfatase activity